MDAPLHYGLIFVVLVILTGMVIVGYRWSVRGALTIEILKMIYGFCLLTMLSGIAITIAVGHVEEKTSFGLSQVITIIGVLSGGFANWAFKGEK